MSNAKKKQPERRHRGIGERLEHAEQVLHDHLLAAEVAAEEAAGYGSVTAAIEAAEAAVDPDRELGEHEKKRARSKRRARPEEQSNTS